MLVMIMMAMVLIYQRLTQTNDDSIKVLRMMMVMMLVMMMMMMMLMTMLVMTMVIMMMIYEISLCTGIERLHGEIPTTPCGHSSGKQSY